MAAARGHRRGSVSADVLEGVGSTVGAPDDDHRDATHVQRHEVAHLGQVVGQAGQAGLAGEPRLGLPPGVGLGGVGGRRDPGHLVGQGGGTGRLHGQDLADQPALGLGSHHGRVSRWLAHTNDTALVRSKKPSCDENSSWSAGLGKYRWTEVVGRLEPQLGHGHDGPGRLGGGARIDHIVLGVLPQGRHVPPGHLDVVAVVGREPVGAVAVAGPPAATPASPSTGSAEVGSSGRQPTWVVTSMRKDSGRCRPASGAGPGWGPAMPGRRWGSPAVVRTGPGPGARVGQVEHRPGRRVTLVDAGPSAGPGGDRVGRGRAAGGRAPPDGAGRGAPCPASGRRSACRWSGPRQPR